MLDTLLPATEAAEPALTFEQARVRFDELRLKHSRLIGVHEAGLRRQKEVMEKVALAKGRQSLHEHIVAVFEKMQEKAHTRSVGSLEDVLTAVVEDNFPGKGGIKLTLGNERGAPALDINLDVSGGTGEPILEDILKQNGGAFNNVVVTGLKYCALARTKNRRLMLLDEPDIWMELPRVRNFFKVLSDTTEKLQTQTLVISHKDPAYFEGRASLIRIYEDGGAIKSTILEPRAKDWTDSSEEGIRYIHAIGIGKHVDTLVHLMPGLNAITGGNGLGKSTLIALCLRALAYGEFPETLMRHELNEAGVKAKVSEAKIIVGVENDMRVEMVRKLKGSPVVTYRVYQGEELVFEGRPDKKNAVPDAVANVLNIRKVDGMDFQLCSQTEPIFLLDEVPSVRARLLTIGRESGHLSAVIAGYSKLKTQDNETVREGEAELTKLSWRLPITQRVVEMAGTFTILNQIVKGLDDATRAEKVLEKLLATITESKKQSERYMAMRNALARLPEVPVMHDNQRLAVVAKRLMELSRKAQIVLSENKVTVPTLHDTKRLQGLCDRIEALGKKAELKVPEKQIVVPALHDNARLAETGRRLAVLKTKVEVMAKVPDRQISVPALQSTDVIARSLVQFDRLAAAEKRLLAEQAALEVEYEAERVKYEALKAEVGNDCPLCGHQLPEGELSHVH